MLSKERLDVVVPLYNEEDCIEELFRRLVKLREKMDFLDMNLIFVNDGSKDKTMDKIRQIALNHVFVKVVDLSRNFGHQIAVTAGLDISNADFIAIIDADLQDPPELIEDMYYKAKEGYDVVYGRRVQRKGETFFKKFTAKMFYKFLSKMCEIEIPQDTGDFRLISRKVLNVLKGMREKHRFLRGMVPWVGFKSCAFDYVRDSRYAGETKYPLKKMIRFALDAIFSFSNTPLRIASYMGLFILLFGFLGSLLMLYLRFFTTYTVPGITAVILTVIIMSGVQIIMLGIIGEYVGRIFQEAKDRPLYVIRELINVGDENGE